MKIIQPSAELIDDINAAETNFSHGYVMTMFKRREPVVFGYNVTYLDRRQGQ